MNNITKFERGGAMPEHDLMPCELFCMLSKLNEKATGTAARETSVNQGELSIEEILASEFQREGQKQRSADHEICDKVGDFTHEKDYRKVIATILSHPNLVSYQLSETDVLIIAHIWNQYQSGRSTGWDFMDVIKPLTDTAVSLVNIRLVASLLDRKILHLNSRGTGDYKRNPRIIIEGSYEPDSMFVNALLGNRLIENASVDFINQDVNYRCRISNILELLGTVVESYPELTENNMDYHGNWYGYVLSPIYHAIMQTVADAPKESVLAQIQAEFELTAVEVLIMLLIHYHSECVRENFSGTRLINIMAADAEDAENLGKVLGPQSGLNKKGIIDNSQTGRLFKHDLSLSDEISRRLRQEDSLFCGERTDWRKLLLDDNRFCLVKTRQTIGQLIVQDEIRDIILSVVKKVKHPDKYDLAQWGLLPDSLSESTGNGVNILLYGAPGTGKTFAAGAIANSLGRELVSLNAPQMKSHYYGDSQQIVKDCFQKMRQMAACENPPVFLLNEADQLIHTRLDLSQSCASTENAIQNIILEELETFPGIFIATTNLLENIDEAFFRRFNYKIELPLPDADCRRQLWKLHLPDTIPGAKYIDIDFLAESYDLTGGQIKLIVANACSHAMIRQINNKHITQIDLISFIHKEINVGTEKVYNIIGFRQF